MAGYLGTKAAFLSTTAASVTGNAEIGGDLTVGSNALFVDESASNVGIGTSSPSTTLQVEHDSGGSNSWTNAGSTAMFTETNAANPASIKFNPATTSNGAQIVWGGAAGDGPFVFRNYNSERLRIDASGNLLVGKTSTDRQTDGHEQRPDGFARHTRSNNNPLELVRKSSNGDILKFYKDGSTVGSIYSRAGIAIGIDSPSGDTAFSRGGTEVLYVGGTAFYPATDNLVDLGGSSNRFDDVYATNGTIQTSDRNEKQDIAALTATEMLVAARISAMFKTFRWIDKVADNPNARTHTGIIAQDVQQAFTDEGLDAGDYSLFISTTWWETQTDVPAVAAVAEVLDDDGNVVAEAVEAKDAYTRTDTYDTQAEAPAGATERTRLGIRYPELLSFLAAYNEQRFASIETRLAALEAV